MSGSVAPSSLVRRVWEDFTEGRDAGRPTINPSVRESWLRSRGHGLNARMKSIPIVLPQDRLEAILHETTIGVPVSQPDPARHPGLGFVNDNRESALVMSALLEDSGRVAFFTVLLACEPSPPKLQRIP